MFQEDPISSLTSAAHFNSLFTLVIYLLMDVLSLMDLLFPPLEFYATSHKQVLDICCCVAFSNKLESIKQVCHGMQFGSIK